MDTKSIHTMAELRQHIDALDDALIDLLADRARLVDRAVALKPKEGLPARIEDRRQQVLTRVQGRAVAKSLDPTLAAKLWDVMIEHFILHEEKVLGK